MYLKNKEIVDFVDGIKWIVLGLVVAGLAGYFGNRFYKNRQALLMAQEEEAFEPEEELEEVDLDTLEEDLMNKKQAIVNLVKQNPDDFAALILNWMDVSMKKVEINEGISDENA